MGMLRPLSSSSRARDEDARLGLGRYEVGMLRPLSSSSRAREEARLGFGRYEVGMLRPLSSCSRARVTPLAARRALEKLLLPAALPRG